MKISIFIIVIVILVMFLIAFFESKAIKKNYISIFFNLIFVILGFSLALLWDNIKIDREERKEAESIVVLLRLETGRIHGAIENNIKNLSIANESPAHLYRLESSSWNRFKLRHNLFINNTGDLIQVENLYTLVSIVNEQIVFRENFINSNFNSTTFIENMRRIDAELLQRINHAKELNQIVQNFLYAIPPHKIEGYNFEMSKGKVKNVSNE